MSDIPSAKTDFGDYAKGGHVVIETPGREDLGFALNSSDDSSTKSREMHPPNDITLPSSLSTAISGAPRIGGKLSAISLFTPLIADVLKLADEIVQLYESAQHNKKICGLLLDRILAAEAAVKDLNIKKQEYLVFFTDQKNYKLFLRFKLSIEKIKKFIEDISQIKGLKKFSVGFLQANVVKKTFDELTSEFDGCMRSLNFSITVETRIQQQKDKEVIDKDIADMKEYLDNIKGGITDLQGGISDAIEYIAALQSLLQKQQAQSREPSPPAKLSQISFSELISDSFIDLNQFTQPEGEVSSGVHRRRKKIDHTYYAFRDVNLNLTCVERTNEEEKTAVKEIREEVINTVNILKRLKDSKNIIEFLGLAEEGDMMYLVYEWAEYGTLSDYYTNYGQLPWSKKIEFAVDIARGLCFLQAVNILHHDIRSENILITEHHQAKIANFANSRGLHDATRNVAANFINIRYMAPEKIMNPNYAYDFRCETYSFGMLLWEIAEEKLPYSDVEDILKVRELACDKYYREPLSPNTPSQYQSIVIQATTYHASERLTITKIFTSLHALLKAHALPRSPRLSSATLPSPAASPRASSDDDDCLIDFGSFNSLTMEDALREHRAKNGNKRLAWETFNLYAAFGDVNAKYWVGYYLYYEMVTLDPPVSKEERLKMAAKMFKEAADAGLPEAQLRFGHCLWRGVGTEKNDKQAIEYFKLAADNGNTTAMYNIGNLYYNGIDVELGMRYLKRAAYCGQAEAAKACKILGIQL
ncbi:3716_t:CDS:2 [Paraglomus occultum]|uniref:3716_t:CDS:1 n=1 Tax=Paraglomus occultum TaxID=144539 RepID=A0A9N9G2N6_9GLOM|nr:3716_t:CDS:2 [Paraglomus occultum]